MSEIDDFELDEDLLRDANEQEELYFTQCTQGNKRARSVSPKINDRLVEKIDSSSKKLCLMNEDEGTNAAKSQSSKKNLLFDILESDTSIINEQTSILSEPSDLDVEEAPSYHQIKNNQIGTSMSSKKKMILDLITDESPNTIQQNCEKTSEATRLLQRLPVNEFNVRNRNNYPNNQKSNFKNSEKPYYGRSINSQPPTQVFSTPKLPKSVVRRFPGPAGLLPENIEDEDDVDSLQIFEAINNYNENQNTSHKKSPTNLCSQDTKKVFCDGAWQRMLNDLPQNFLKGYNISTIKRMRHSKKISLLAAIIHKIDLTAEHPKIYLKDISDSIEGMMHKDIFMTYENFLKTGVVLLLRNVGLLRCKGTQTFYKASMVMITRVSILGIYSDTERLVTTPALEEILRSNPNYVEQPKGSNNSRLSKAALLECLGIDSSSLPIESKSIDKKFTQSASSETIIEADDENENEKITRKPSNAGESRAQFFECLGMDLSISPIKSKSNSQLSSDNHQEIKNLDSTENLNNFDDINVLDVDNDAFDSFNIDNADEIEAACTQSKQDTEPLVNDKNESINNSTEEKSDQLGDSGGNISAGFADHLLDNSDDLDDTDDIISQIDVETFKSNYPVA